MKRLLLLCLLMSSIHSFAQDSPESSTPTNALGIRIPGGFTGSGAGVEISYQRHLRTNNRLEIDFGTARIKNATVVGITGIYQWLYNLKGGLNWYVGPGASLKYVSKENSDNALDIGIGGQIGLEYDFNHIHAPLNLSLDYRPMILFDGNSSFSDYGIALGIRYTF